METIPQLFVLVFSCIGLIFVFYLCFTQSGRNLHWDLLKLNPAQQAMFKSREAHKQTLILLGIIFCVILVSVIIFISYKLLF
jgi:formate/nitrite transporter FocA (FNT family)